MTSTRNTQASGNQVHENIEELTHGEEVHEDYNALQTKQESPEQTKKGTLSSGKLYDYRRGVQLYDKTVDPRGKENVKTPPRPGRNGYYSSKSTRGKRNSYLIEALCTLTTTVVIQE